MTSKKKFNNFLYRKFKSELFVIIVTIIFLMAKNTVALVSSPAESNKTTSNALNPENSFSTEEEHFSFFDFFKSISDELGLFPIEFLDSGLHFTILMPAIDEVLAFITQVLEHQYLDFVHHFERILFGYLPPANLTTAAYARTFPGTKFYIKNITDDIVQVGRYLVDINKFTTISNYIMIYYMTSPEPK